jgi:hypothetical protein
MGRRPVGKVAMTGAERQRRYWLKRRAVKPAPKPGGTAAAEIEALQKELAAAKAEITALKDDLLHARLAFRFGPKRREPAKPKTERPPLPPDEERERQIKTLKTRVRNLTAELHMIREWKEAAKNSGMSFATRSAIMKPLHPDSRKHLTEAELQAALDSAGKAFTAWIASLKPARR